MTLKIKRSLGPADCEAWNKTVVVGTPVIVKKDDGSEFQTRTRSAAWMIGASSRSTGHTAVVSVDGISGGYLLNRVRVAPAAAASQGGASGEVAQ